VLSCLSRSAMYLGVWSSAMSIATWGVAEVVRSARIADWCFDGWIPLSAAEPCES
jgi:hypothetical protein